MPVAVEQLRGLIVEAAPDPALAAPALSCGEDALLDDLIPFSSMIVLGSVIAVEDRFGITVKRTDLARVLTGGVTLLRLATMIEELRQ